MTRPRQRAPRQEHIRRKILQQRGLSTTREKRTKQFHQSPPLVTGYRKTWAMKATEHRYRLPLEDILTSGSLREIQKRFHIHYSTACKWRKRLGLSGDTD